MLQVHTSQRVEQVEIRLRMIAPQHGGAVLAITDLGQVLGRGGSSGTADAVAVTVCFADLYEKLLRAEIRFAAILPSRIAVCAKGEGAILETISPRDWCRELRRPDLEPVAASLEDLLRQVMEEAGRRQAHPSGEHQPTEDLVNMRAALPQRIDCRGTKIEELAGTGVHDAAGG